MTTQGKNGTVEFRFFRPQAREVRLVGDFNGWGRANGAGNAAGNGTDRGYSRAGVPAADDAGDASAADGGGGEAVPGTPMRRDANGWWTARLELGAGEYRFRYVADGDWFTDFAANGIELTKFGWNSVLVVHGRAIAGDDTGDVDGDVEAAPRTAREDGHHAALLVA